MIQYELYLKQIASREIKTISSKCKKITVIVLQNEQGLTNYTVESLKDQYFRDFNIVENMESLKNILNGGGTDRSESWKEASYVFLMRDGNKMLPTTLEDMYDAIEKRQADLVYGDEYENCESYFIPKMLEEFSVLAMCHNVFDRQSILCKKELFLDILPQLDLERKELIISEIFYAAILKKKKIYHLPLFVLEANGYLRLNNLQILAMQPYIEKVVKKYGLGTEIKAVKENGEIAFAIENGKTEQDFTCYIVVENLKRSARLLLSFLKQKEVEYNIVFISDQKNWLDKLEKMWKKGEGAAAIHFCYSEHKNYSFMLYEALKIDKYKRLNSVVLRDNIEKFDEEDFKRLVNCIKKDEYVAVSPKIISNKKEDVVVYGGGFYQELSLNKSALEGCDIRHYGLDETLNRVRVVSFLSSYCYAVDTEIMLKCYPEEKEYDAEQLCHELSFLFTKQERKMVFYGNISIRSSYEKKSFPQDYRYVKDGCYWHWLCEYGTILAYNRGNIPWLNIIWKSHLSNIFAAYGLENLAGKGSAEQKRVLVYSHELSLTGAPIVLAQAVRVLKKYGYAVVVISPKDGKMKEEYLKEGTPVLIDPQLEFESEWIKMAADFDMVLVSTIVPFKSVERLGKIKVPVLWWIHDAREGYEAYLQYVLPRKLGKNVRLYCGGGYAKKVINYYRPKYKAGELLYGLEDKLNDKCENYPLNVDSNKIIFANIGAIDTRKGQDIFADAISLLPDSIIRKCYFLFVGAVGNEGIYNKIVFLMKRYPENVGYIKFVERDRILSIYKQADVLVCSSRDDPMPAFITEGMMFSKIIVCSENTGTAFLIENDVDGYIYKKNSKKQLKDKIEYIADHLSVARKVGEKSRLIYEKNFESTIFENKLMGIVEQMMSGEKI